MHDHSTSINPTQYLNLTTTQVLLIRSNYEFIEAKVVVNS